MISSSENVSVKLKEKLKMAMLYPIFDIGKNMSNVISDDKYFYFQNKILTGKELCITASVGKKNEAYWWVDNIDYYWYLTLKMDGSGGLLFCEKKLNKSFYKSLWALNITVVNSKQDVDALKRRYTIEDIIKDE